MRSKKSAAVLAGALAAGSILVSAPAASANSYCSSSGYTEGGFPNLRCTKLTNGVLSHGKRDLYPTYGTGVYTTYYKSGGSAVSVRLGWALGGASPSYSSYFTIESGKTVSRSWTTSANNLCLNSTGFLSYSGGTYQTPAAHC
ncbi:hypothetical protein ACFFSH_36775 [Streptomyces filamentosus]|uniref:Secreted protein n=1 Tax=Streptomyces filamentosus TaxID=67294 RepID=A0A919EPC2_STRFL|nr:hypothetical protein [Streptomyces filamentosus]GHG04973.1 hypothetical protein GCM10017667_39530 [Streptomyces filamentosus]